MKFNKETQKYINAFVSNFGNIRIEKITYDKGYYVYYPESAQDYIQYCYNVDYLRGWLYGAVQCKNVFPMYEKLCKKEGK